MCRGPVWTALRVKVRGLFFTRHWAVFFFILALFSLFFPWYQAWRGRILYAVLSVALSLPLILMGGWFRPALGVVLRVLGGWGIWKQLSSAGTAMRPPPRTGQ